MTHRAIDGWMLLLSALLMPCTPFRIGPTSIERELAELEQAAERAGLDGVRLPFELDLVPAMFQHLLSTGALNRRHVLYQSVDRFCAEALGLESELTRADPSRYDTLLEFGKTLVSRFGRGANALLHGQGNASDLAAAGGGIASVAHTSSHEFVQRRNFGTFSNNTIQRSFPTVEHGSVLQMYDVLNLFISAQRNSSAIWHPVDGKTMIAIDAGIDGMLIGIGAMVDESALEVAGFERPIRPDEAERVANMDDAQLAAWLKENAFVKEGVEVMAMVSDASVSCRIGYRFDTKQHDALHLGAWLSKDVVRPLRVCYCCLREAYEKGRSWDWAIKRCNAYVECEACDNASPCGMCDHHEHWSKVRCNRCINKGCECVQFFLQSIGMDLGGGQARLVRLGGTRPFDKSVRAQLGAFRDVELHSDGVHDIKSGVRNMTNWKLRRDGQYQGTFLFWSRYYDANPQVRGAMRAAVTRAALRGKNPFSIEEKIMLVARPLQRAMLTEAERRAGSAPVISIIGPEIHKSWSSNTPSAYGNPGGGCFHPKSSLYIYADSGLRQVRRLRLGRSPADNEVLISSAAHQLVSPTAVALLGDVAFITDPGQHESQLLMVDLHGVFANFGAASVARDDGGELSGSSSSAPLGGRGVKLQLKKVALSYCSTACGDDAGTARGDDAGEADGGEADGGDAGGGGSSSPGRGRLITEAYGIAADADARAVFITDRRGKAVFRITFTSNYSAGVVQPLGDQLPAEPTGIAVVPGRSQVAVAAVDSILLLDRTSGAWTCVLNIVNADFHGVSVLPDGTLYAVAMRGNAIYKQDPPYTTSAELVAGGNADYPDGFFYTGSASHVKLWQPTFCSAVHNMLLISHVGGGLSAKLLLLSDAYDFVTSVMTSLCTLGDIFQLTPEAGEHSCDYAHALSMFRDVELLLQSVEDENYRHVNSRGVQGQAGNFSNDFRLSVRNNRSTLLRQAARLLAMDVPADVVSTFEMKARLTLMVERAFVKMRSKTPYPLSLEYSWQRAQIVEEEFKETNGVEGFSVWFGERRSRMHYMGSGVPSAAQHKLCAPRKPKNKINREERVRQLAILRRCAALFPRVRMQRVTDHGKEKAGTLPGVAYAPAIIPMPDDWEATRASLATTAIASSRGGRAGREGGSQLQIAYHANEMVVIKPDRGQGGGAVWLGSLLEPCLQWRERSGAVRLEKDRLGIRYFVQVDALTVDSASQMWGTAAEERLAAERVKAAEASGVLYVFWGDALVSVPAIYGSTSPLNMQLGDGKVIRFELSTASFDDALELVQDFTTSAPSVDPEESGEGILDPQAEFRVVDPTLCDSVGGASGVEQCTFKPFHNGPHSWELVGRGGGRPSASLRDRRQLTLPFSAAPAAAAPAPRKRSPKPAATARAATTAAAGTSQSAQPAQSAGSKRPPRGGGARKGKRSKRSKI